MRKILLVETKLHLRQWPNMIFTIGLPLALLLGLGSLPDLAKPDPGMGGERGGQVPASGPVTGTTVPPGNQYEEPWTISSIGPPIGTFTAAAP